MFLLIKNIQNIDNYYLNECKNIFVVIYTLKKKKFKLSLIHINKNTINLICIEIVLFVNSVNEKRKSNQMTDNLLVSFCDSYNNLIFINSLLLLMSLYKSIFNIFAN